MNYKKITLLAVIGCFLLIGCKSEQKPKTAKDYLRPASMVYTAEDTVQIRQLVADYIAAFKNKDFDITADMLYKVKNDSIFPLSDAEKNQYKKAMRLFPIYDVTEKSFVLRSDKNNEVRLMVQIIPSGSLEKEIGVTTISLNPVVKEGKWYLTMLDESAEGVDIHAN